MGGRSPETVTHPRARPLLGAKSGAPGEGTVLVLGAGVSGKAAARLLGRLGVRVLLYDDRAGQEGLDRGGEEGLGEVVGPERLPGALRKASAVVVSPGFPPRHPAVKAARQKGLPLMGELDLGWEFIEAAQVVGVTGTDGKSTTAACLAHLLRAGGLEARAIGNIGEPVSALAGARLDAAVLELSSFQLYYARRLRLDLVVLLNFAPDHLDWHGSLLAYSRAKARILAFLGKEGTLLYNCADRWCRRRASRARREGKRAAPFSRGTPDGGFGVERGEVVGPGIRLELPPWARGPFLEDAVAAAAAGFLLGLQEEVLRAGLASFRPLEHRAEEVGTVGGVRFVDDSKATNPHSASESIRAYPGCVAIMGGRNKGLDLRPMVQAAKECRGVVLLGETAAVLEGMLEGVPVRRARDMGEAVRAAYRLARGEGVVLLAPGAASFDLFRDYRERGEAFRRAVAELARGEA